MEAMFGGCRNREERGSCILHDLEATKPVPNLWLTNGFFGLSAPCKWVWPQRGVAPRSREQRTEEKSRLMSMLPWVYRAFGGPCPVIGDPQDLSWEGWGTTR